MSDERLPKLTFRPKNTLAIYSARAPLDSALAIDAPGAVEPLVQYG